MTTTEFPPPGTRLPDAPQGRRGHQPAPLPPLGPRSTRAPGWAPRLAQLVAGSAADSSRVRWWRRRAAAAVLRAVARRVPVEIVLPDGRLLARPAAPDGARARLPRLVLHRPEEVYRRLAQDPKQGIGEAYTAGDWDVAPGTDLAEALAPFAARLSTAVPGWLLRWRRAVDRPLPADQHGDAAHTRANVGAHYDLSNDLFAAFLDPTLSYSSALFDPDWPLHLQSLEQAQLRKVRAALDGAGVGAGSEVLEIGTGWGTLAIEAARRGARVTTATLSVEQAALAEERIARAGLDHLVTVLVCDYRDLQGSYDAVVSIEMVEAVGERYWPAYFATLSRLVRPGGAVLLQAILMEHERYLATRHSYGWIQKHIFPGGLIPSRTAIEEHAGAAGLRLDGDLHFGADYAETLRRWRDTFVTAWPELAPRLVGSRFDEEFRRTWEFYLAYCEAGFATGYLDVAQLRLVPAEEAA